MGSVFDVVHFAEIRSVLRRPAVWWSFVAVSLGGLVISGHWLHRQQTALAAARAELQQVSREEVAAAPAAVPGDFVRGLDSDPSLATWSHDLQRAAVRLGVSLLSVSNAVAPRQAEGLGRNDVQLVLRGPYPQVKQLLSETQDRHPSTSVGRLTMRSLAGGPEVEASVSLVRWLAPLPAPAASR